MNFTGIGKIGAFVKQKNLLYAANYKIKTGQTLVDGSGRLNFKRSTTMFNSVNSAKKNSSSAADKARLASIKQKLKSGKKLSEAEMNYLRQKDEKLYKKAKYAEEAREELKNELRAAKTKQEARQAVMRATAKVAADATADLESVGGGGGNMNLGGGLSFGADMNFGGDLFGGMNSGEISADINLDAGAENISVDTSGEISTAENFGNENISLGENFNSENNGIFNAENISNGEDSDSAFDILDKYIYAIRAIQDEWLEFIKSDDYKYLPEDFLETAEINNEKKSKIASAQFADAFFAYQKSMTYRKNL